MTTASIPVQDRWKLDDVYTGDDAFARDRQELQSLIPTLGRWCGTLAQSAATLLEALECITDAQRRLARLRCYAFLNSDADTRVTGYQALRQEVEMLSTGLSGVVAYLTPEILAIDPAILEGFIASEPGLSTHAFFLRDLMRQRQHVRGPAEEKIIAESGLLTRSASSLYQVLQNVELPRPEVELSTGETVRLSPVEFHKQRSSRVRRDREVVFPAYYRAHQEFQGTLAQNLTAAVRGNMFHARVRQYPHCLAAALDRDNVPLGVYHNLIERVHEHLPVLHRYFRLRARVLGVERLRYSDLYCPLSSAPPSRYSPAEARQLVLRATRPLGETYGRALEAAFDQRWIDWHPTPGKRAGAYATGWAYDAHPFVLVNFTGDYESVSTLAHEMGHAMHSYFSNRSQPFALADYTIFVAEVASTLNEALLSHLMLERSTDPDSTLFLLGSYMDGIRGTLFRQAMFAEFELAIHERAERGEALTSDTLNEMYLALLRRYHGHEAGVMEIDEAFAIEWAAIPHFYYNFYVYQYATGIVAATALARRLLDGVADAPARYLEFLSAGGSDYPLALLRRAGVDLESAEPFLAAFATVDRQLDALEDQLDAGD